MGRALQDTRIRPEVVFKFAKSLTEPGIEVQVVPDVIYNATLPSAY